MKEISPNKIAKMDTDVHNKLSPNLPPHCYFSKMGPKGAKRGPQGTKRKPESAKKVKRNETCTNKIYKSQKHVSELFLNYISLKAPGAIETMVFQDKNKIRKRYDKNTKHMIFILFSFLFHIFFIFWAHGPMGPGPGAVPPPGSWGPRSNRVH